MKEVNNEKNLIILIQSILLRVLAGVSNESKLLNNNIVIIKMDEFNIEYLKEKDGELYKYIEKIIPNTLYETSTAVYKKSNIDGDFKKISTITTYTVDGIQVINEKSVTGEITVREVALIKENEYGTFMEGLSISPYSYGNDWIMRDVQKVITFAKSATIAAGIAGVIGKGIPFAGDFFSGAFAGVAYEISRKSLSECTIIGTSGYKYSRPNIYTKYDLKFYTPQGDFIKRETGEYSPRYVG